MKAKKIGLPVKVLNAEQALKESGMTREEWNNRIAEQVKQIEADESLSREEKDQKIANLLVMTITKNNRFLIEEVLTSSPPLRGPP